MKNLFDRPAYEEIVQRLQKLQDGTAAKWGKMNAAQMLAHLNLTYKMPLGNKKIPRSILGLLLGWMFKKKLYDDVPYSEGLPTSPVLKVTNERNFEEEKKKLLESMEKFTKLGPDGINKNPHPMFGSFTPEQWGMSMYKHADHHLRQFGG